MDKKAGSRDRKRKYQILALLSGIVFLCCAVWLAAYLAGLKRAGEELEAVRESYVTENGSGKEEESGQAVPGGTAEQGQAPEETGSGNEEGQAGPDGTEPLTEESESGEAPGYELPDRSIDIAALQEEVNPDIYAWLTVPGTVIDYPVLQHPEEMDYYLEYNMDGTKGRPGCIYTQRMNSKDWTDPNTVLYGHNMRNGTMFADLHKFEDGTFFEENRYLYVYTEDGRVLVYEIFAAYATGNEHQLMSYNIYTEDGFQGYLDNIPNNTGKNCHFLEGRELTAEDRIITLSTCIGGQATRRYLVQGVLAAEEEQP